MAGIRTPDLGIATDIRLLEVRHCPQKLERAVTFNGTFVNVERVPAAT
ncbi:MAG: hypothetical protein P8Z30_12995 [Acidobacteriota bacterium]